MGFLMNKRFVWIPESIETMTPSLVSRVTKKKNGAFLISILYPYAKVNKKGVQMKHKVLHEEEVMTDLKGAMEKSVLLRKEIGAEISVKYQKTLHISAPKQGRINLKKT